MSINFCFLLFPRRALYGFPIHIKKWGEYGRYEEENIGQHSKNEKGLCTCLLLIKANKYYLIIRILRDFLSAFSKRFGIFGNGYILQLFWSVVYVCQSDNYAIRTIFVAEPAKSIWKCLTSIISPQPFIKDCISESMQEDKNRIIWRYMGLSPCSIQE